MSRKVVYWISTAIISLGLLGSLSYLAGSKEVVEGFAQGGWPPYLRIVLGIVKPAAAVVLLLPGLPLMKEWAYTGVAITWIMATISAYDTAGPWYAPLAALGLMVVSYLTRPAGRRLATG
jgi:uncharacterized membrane protein YedE/YeeE